MQLGQLQHRYGDAVVVVSGIADDDAAAPHSHRLNQHFIRFGRPQDFNHRRCCGKDAPVAGVIRLRYFNQLTRSDVRLGNGRRSYRHRQSNVRTDTGVIVDAVVCKVDVTVRRIRQLSGEVCRRIRAELRRARKSAQHHPRG